MVTDLYSDGGYLEKHPNWHVEDAAWKAGNIYRMIQKNGLNPVTVCEIGCGAGEILVQLQKQLPENVTFDGFEVSPQAYDMSRQRENNHLHFYLRSLQEIHLTQKYDLTLMIDVFEHVDDFYGFIRMAGRIGQQTIFHIPLDLSVQSILRGDVLMRKRIRSGHIHYFTKDTALAALRDSGYKIIDFFYTGSYTELPSRTFKSRLAKIPRKILFSINNDFGARLLGGYSLMVLAESVNQE